MMRSKLIPYIVIICIIFTLVFVLSGCDVQDYSEISNANCEFEIVSKSHVTGQPRDNAIVMYDKTTKVMYLFYDTYYSGGITPLYNADGSLQIYEGE